MCQASEGGNAGVPVESLHEVHGEWSEICAEEMRAGYDAGNNRTIIFILELCSISMPIRSFKVCITKTVRQPYLNHSLKK